MRKISTFICLFDPFENRIYSKTILAPNKMYIAETFEAKPGYWKLKYKSNEGFGEIDMHLKKDYERAN